MGFKLAEKGYAAIKTISIVAIIMITVLVITSAYNNNKQKKYLEQLDSTAITFIEDVETHISEIVKEPKYCDIYEINEKLEEVSGIELVADKKDDNVVIQSDNKDDEQWAMEVNWQYGTNNLSVFVYDPTGTYMWSNHFPKERFEMY